MHLSYFYLVYRSDWQIVAGANDINSQGIFLNTLFVVGLNVAALKDTCIWLKTFHGLQCTEKDLAGINISMIVIGLANIAACIAFIRCLKMKLKKAKHDLIQKQHLEASMLTFDNPIVDSTDPDYFY